MAINLTSVTGSYKPTFIYLCFTGISVTYFNYTFQRMAKSNPGNTEKNLISRRTLLNNSLLTGLSLATGSIFKGLIKYSTYKIKRIGF